jgi:hypothetical protein
VAFISCSYGRNNPRHENGLLLAKSSSSPVIDGKPIELGRVANEDKLWLLSITIKDVLSSEEGQDLVEDSLIVALVAFAATVGMGFC